MSRLTDERIDEILRPKDLMGETELQALAREVRELREHNASEYEHRKAVVKMFDERKTMLSTIEQLTRDLAEANRTIDLQCRQISHQANQCQLIENERDAARELLRRFRELFPDKWHVREVDDFATVVKYQASAVCRDYDATQTQQSQPTQVELVPWTAETRPRGPMTLRKSGQTAAEFAPGWNEYGETSEGSRLLWDTLLEEYEWSRDGITWERCGTEVAR